MAKKENTLKKNQKYDWDGIVERFKESTEYSEFRSYCLEVEGISQSTYSSGQAQRKLSIYGGVKEIQKSKEIEKANKTITKVIKKPLSYAPKEIVLNNPNDLRESAKMAKNSLYKALIGTAMSLEAKVQNGEIDESEIVKNAKGFETMVNLFEAIESGAKNLMAHQAGNGKGGGEGGRNNPPSFQFLIVKDDQKKPKGKVVDAK